MEATHQLNEKGLVFFGACNETEESYILVEFGFRLCMLQFCAKRCILR